uniref:Pogo transposable element with KRAB domain-like n=1 Tax=Saccoglossus kowalevskii TaxID=10224 RepID=A0ABM0MCC2_SACKO|nr:PREDICTED: pogo transposable element with KRAB domain-like [Saccoglossus kowalevskii]
MPKETTPRSSRRRAAYDVSFKLKVISTAIEWGNNRKTADHYGLNEKQVREWLKKKDQLGVTAKSSKRLAGGGRQVKDKDADNSLMSWFESQRTNGNGVTGKQLQRQALRVSTSANFKASDGWLRSFKHRHSLSTHQRTSIGQKLPPDFEETVILFHRFVIRLREQHQYPLSDIYNMDETPLRFDMPGNKTLEHTGVKTVHIKTTGNEKKVSLWCSQLLPMGQRCLDYIRRTFPHREDDSRRLSVWDSCTVHLTDNVKAALRERNIDVAVIPGGLTSILQPLDIGINKPIKETMHDLWDLWMKEGEAEFTPTGKRKCPSREMVVQWVSKPWEKLSETTIQRSFLKPGISNNLDGMEDDLLFDDLQSEDDDDDYDTEAIAEEIGNIFDDSDDED